MTSSRRDLFGSLAAIASSMALPAPTAAKEISADPALSILVVELDSGYEPLTAEQLVRIESIIQQKTGVRALVVSDGIKIRAIPADGVYQREVLGGYEYEIIAKNEEDLKKRYEAMFRPRS